MFSFCVDDMEKNKKTKFEDKLASLLRYMFWQPSKSSSNLKQEKKMN
jgi:hypothetical protein